MDWRDAFEKEFGSNASKAARSLHPAWRENEPKEAKKVSERSLANRIGTLFKEGDRTGWWERHPKPARIFAELLGVEREEILGVPPRTLAFAEFPRLPPMAPNEEPCRVDRDGWLLHVVLKLLKSGRGWIIAPPGSGKSLVVHYIQERLSGGIAAETVPTLSSSAAAAATSLPLVIEVEAIEPGRDLQSLGPLATRPVPTVVMAPFPFPESTWLGMGSRVGHTESGWSTVDASPTGDWRERMLEWIDKRLEATSRDPKLIKEYVQEWLARNDPSGRLVATQGDLLALCADFDAHGSYDSDTVKRARRWFEEVGVSMLPPEIPASWRRHAAEKSYSALAWRRLRSITREYATFDQDAWCALVPQEVMPASAGDLPGAAVVVGYLREAGLLRGASRGLVLYPSWVSQAAEVEALASVFDDGSASEWGALAADEGRQQVVDEALDAIPESSLRALVRSLVAQGEPKSLCHLAAVEATLASLARRLFGGNVHLDKRDIAAAQQLMLRQVGVLVPEAGDRQVHHPFTRRSIDEWFATAWTLSLQIPRPRGFSRDDLAWELPGWAGSLPLSDVPQRMFPTSVLSPWGASGSVQTVAALASEVVGGLDTGDVPKEVPRVLLPALFLSPSDWKLEPFHLDILQGSWEERFLGDQVSQLPRDRRVELAGRIWHLVTRPDVADGAVPVAERIQMLRLKHPGLTEFVLGNVAATELAQTARDHGIHRRYHESGHHPSDPLELLALPRVSRQAALRAWLEGATAREARFDEARELVPLLDASDIDLALDLVRAGDRHIAAEFTSFVWTKTPARAREEARLALENNLPSVEGWYWQAPRAELPHLVSLVLDLPSPPEWVRTWAMQRVLDGGEAAEQLFGLAQPAT